MSTTVKGNVGPDVVIRAREALRMCAGFALVNPDGCADQAGHFSISGGLAWMSWNVSVRCLHLTRTSQRWSKESCERIGIRMDVQEQIEAYLSSQPAAKQSDMRALHGRILQVMPGCKLWFLDGKNSENKTVSNPNIGYGLYTIRYADGSSKDFYQIGMSANTSGISVYILGIKDKTYLSQTYGASLGKASVTGYCIKFKALKDINIETLEAAIRYGAETRE